MVRIYRDTNAASSQKPLVANQDTTERFDATMQSIDIKQREQETASKAELAQIPYIDLKGFPISPESLSLIPEETARSLQALVFYYGSNNIRIGAVNPADGRVQKLAQELEDKHKVTVAIYMISQHSFDLAVKLYASLPRIRKFVAGVEITEQEIKKYEQEITTFRDLKGKLEGLSITDKVTLILAAAMKARSSDIHIEAEEHAVKVRYRIDGILHTVAELDKELWPRIVTRIKLVAGLKINITDAPQDGRFTIFMTNEKVDVRVSALPTTFGESIVMRLLMSSAVGLSFEDLGLRGKAYDELKLEIKKPNGMIVTTGPTGSGKTTTLYAILNKLNKPGTKIITIEDPVEYKLEGINQSQVNPAKDYTFATGLRSIVRQDPDIIMVGEIRDLETADIAINASQTGHLVISTLHTNDAAGTVPRLLAMGVKPFLLAPAINAMIGQRLVRRICEHCKEKIELDTQTRSRVMKLLNDIPDNSGHKIQSTDFNNLNFYRGGGCDECQGIGYKGRIGIYEVVTMNKDIESMVLSGAVSEYDMHTIAKKHGTVTMIQDGLLKAIEGITTVEEIFRVAKDIGDTL